MTRVGTAPSQYFGGKAQLAPRIAALLPPHRVYCEPFLGMGSVFFAKAPAELSVLNDRDGLLVNFFRVLRDPAKGAKLKEALTLTLYAREEWADARLGLKAYARGWDSAADDVELARRWFVLSQMSFAGRITNAPAHEAPGWRYATKPGHNPAQSFRSAIDRLPPFIARLANTQIEHDDALSIIARYDDKGVVMYLDPPYEPSTRRGGGYAHEMTTDDHVALLDAITASGFKSAVVLSGYDSALYRERLEVTPPPERRWQRLEVTVACSAAGRVRAGGGKLRGEGAVYRAGQTRTEVLWLNPAAQVGHGLWTDYGAGLDSDTSDTDGEPPPPETVKRRRPAAKGRQTSQTTVRKRA